MWWRRDSKAGVRNRVNRTETGQSARPPELRGHPSGFARMTVASEKLRALARQSRTLSRLVPDGHRARSLLSLASVYERQAAEIEQAGDLLSA
jgi:hypothetical protein